MHKRHGNVVEMQETSRPPLTQAERRVVGLYDHVTGLPNRLLFVEDFERLRGSGATGRTLVLVTLAEARHYNEILRALGHAFAEDFVRSGMQRLRDILPYDASLYQVSVLSFAFVAEHDDPVTMPEIALKASAAFAGDLDVEGIPIRTHVGVGLVPIGATKAEPAEVLRSALVAAQDSRREDRGVAFYNHRSDAAHMRAFHILAALPGAIAAPDQLSLHFQPRIDLQKGTVRGAEALLRWQHPEIGVISPAECIPLAEQTSLIHPLTDWVIRSTLSATTELRHVGHDLRMSVNVSPLNLSEPGFDDRLFWACEGADVPLDRIEVEFTEGILAANHERVARQLDRLRRAGVRVAIDDFGTGFSNLSYLKDIPADVLKIDQSFIRPMPQSDDFLVRQIISLAHGLGLDVCAEGIENREAMGLLQSMGCNEGQGYYIARPMQANQFGSWLADGTLSRSFLG